MKSRDFKTSILQHAVFLFQNCQSTVSVACFSFAKVRARDSHGNPRYAQVNIQENSSYVVIIEAPYLLGSQTSALIINSL